MFHLVTWKYPDSQQRRVTQFETDDFLLEEEVARAFRKEVQQRAIVLACRPLGRV